MTTLSSHIRSIRRDYGQNALLEKNLFSDPFLQFETWLKEAIEEKVLDPTNMVLATVDQQGCPDTRVVLLKGFDKNGFVFFTHYNSPKAIQAENIGCVALNFYWCELARQVRVKGTIQRIPRHESEEYFSSRPRESQIGALASQQSNILSSRDELEKKIKDITNLYQGKPIPCPEQWGGYCVAPFELEFFQGRDNRLNDRIRYRKLNHNWTMERLSP